MHPRDLRISDFTYVLPEERIARQPLTERDASKLLVFRNGNITDDRFAQLAAHLPQGSLLILNHTRVVHARILFQRATGAMIECMLHEPADARPMEEALADRERCTWRCMIGNARRWKGEQLSRRTGEDALHMIKQEEREGEFLITFTWTSGRTFAEILAIHGSVPLPPYMKRPAEVADAERYNTVFATFDGSVAAPTASLHFTRTLLGSLREKDVDTAEVVLHVGAGTFLPVKSTHMAQHAMHAEQVRVPRATVLALLDKLGRAPIVPVGTTALRTIESLCWFGDDLLNGLTADLLRVEQWRPYEREAHDTKRSLEAVLEWMTIHDTDHIVGSTSLLIAPGYRFRLADGLVTNFHQPGSTLLLLVAAFLGDQWRAVYEHALANDHRFLSYGDGSLLWRDGR